MLALPLAVLWVRYIGHAPSRTIPGDFEVYHHAWERYRMGVSPYEATEYSAFKYSPAFLAAMGWLPVSRLMAWQVFGSVLLACLGLTIALGVPRENQPSPRPLVQLILGWALAWKGGLEVLDYGQTEPFLMVLTVWAAWLYTRGRSGAAGILVGILPAFKLPWLIFAPLFFLMQEPRKGARRDFILGGVVAIAAWLIVIPLLVFGPQRAPGLTAGWIALLGHQPGGLFEVDINQGLYAQMQRWVGLPVLAMGLALVVGGALLRVLMLKLDKLRSPVAPLEWLPQGWLLGQLASPLAWRWGSVFALGIPFAVRVKSRRAKSVFVLCVVGVLWILQLNPVVEIAGFSHWTELHPYGLITLYWIALILV